MVKYAKNGVAICQKKWEQNHPSAIRAFLRGAANGGADIPRYLLEELEKHPPMSINSFVQFAIMVQDITEQRRLEHVKSLKGSIYRPRKKNAIRFKRTKSGWILRWFCKPRKTEDGKCISATNTKITLFETPVKILVTSNNERSLTGRLAAVCGKRQVPTAVHRVLGT